MTPPAFNRFLAKYAIVAAGAPIVIRFLSGPLCGTDVISLPGIVLVIALGPVFGAPALVAAIVASRAARYGLIGDGKGARLGLWAFLLIPLILTLAAQIYDVTLDCLHSEREPVLSFVAVPVTLFLVLMGSMVYWVRFRRSNRNQERA